MPDISFNHVLNHPRDSIRLSDFRGKAVLLDFWSTWCSICIQQFPKLAGLQKRFKDSLVVLTVGFDGVREGSIERFVTGLNTGAGLVGLPVAVQSAGDSVLSRLFPYQGLPHVVWIDAEGKLRAVTDHLQVTESHVRKLIGGGKVQLRAKRFQRAYRHDRPYLLDGNGGRPDAFAARMVITPYNDSIPGTRSVGMGGGRMRLFYPNMTVRALFRAAMLGLDGMDWLKEDPSFKHVVVQGHPVLPEWEWHDVGNLDMEELERFYDALYCYELIVPEGTDVKRAHRMMLTQLSAYFGYRIRVVKMKRDVLELAGSGTSPAGSDTMALKNLVYRLNRQYPDAPPFVAGRPSRLSGFEIPPGLELIDLVGTLRNHGINVKRKKHRTMCLVLEKEDP